MGYATKGIPANTFRQVGAQFEGVVSGDLLLDEVFSGLPGLDWDEDGIWMLTAPHIQIVKADGTPDKYYYCSTGWYDNGTPDGDFKAGWCDADGSIVDLTIDPGAGFWLKNGSADDKNLQGAGQVPAPKSADAPVDGGIWSIQANVFPMDVNLNDESKVTFPGIVGVEWDEDGVWMLSAPHIQVVKADGTPDKYYYCSTGWYDNGTPDGDFKAGWCDADGSIVDVEIPAQSGFWVKSQNGAFTIRYSK